MSELDEGRAPTLFERWFSEEGDIRRDHLAQACPQCPYWAGRDRFTHQRIQLEYFKATGPVFFALLHRDADFVL